MVLSDVVRYDVEGSPRIRRTGVRPESDGLSRRSLLGRALLVGTAVGVSVLGVLPPARRAAAYCAPNGELHDDMLNGCTAANAGDDCWPGCGPSPVYDGACDASGWHLTMGSWRNRPNECRASDGKDGWYWWLTCNCSGDGCYKRFKCHDGCFQASPGNWVKSICRTYPPGCLCI